MRRLSVLCFLAVTASLVSCSTTPQAVTVPLLQQEQMLQPIAIYSVDAINNNQMCDTCLWLVNTTEDYLNRTQTKREIIDFIMTEICPNLPGDMELQCQTLATVLVPNIIKWVLDTFDANTACMDVGICPSSTPGGSNSGLAGRLRLQLQQQQQLDSWQDLTCPACEFMLQSAVQQLLDPDFQSMVVQLGQGFCVLVPKADQKDCKERVQTMVDQAAKVLAEVEPRHACEVAQACPPNDTTLLTGPSAAAREQLARVRSRLAARLAEVQRSNGAYCEVCEVVVMEAAALVADPDMQGAATAAAKGACSMTGSWSGQCSTYVDEYLPVAFNLALLYLKPGPLCSGIGACDTQQAAAMMAGAVSGGGGGGASITTVVQAS